MAGLHTEVNEVDDENEEWWNVWLLFHYERQPLHVLLVKTDTVYNIRVLTAGYLSYTEKTAT